MSGILYDFPSSLLKPLNKVDIQSLVLVRVFEEIASLEELNELREDLRFSVEYHRNHKKINGVTSKGCGCAYCNALNKYSLLAIRMHRLSRMIDDRWYGNLYDSVHLIREYEKVEKEKVEAREGKNRLKEQLALPRLFN